MRGQILEEARAEVHERGSFRLIVDAYLSLCVGYTPRGLNIAR